MSTEVYNVPHYIWWDWRVGADLFFGGIGVGAFLFAVLVDWWKSERLQRVGQTAACIAPAGVILGVLFLMMEMGHPERMLNTFTAIRPTSALWWGGIAQTLLVAGSLWYAFRWSRPEHNPDRRRTLGVILVPIAVAVGGYHGFLLSALRARPMWNTGPTTVAAILGFLTTGIATVLLVHIARGLLAGRLRDPQSLIIFLHNLRFIRNVLGTALMLQIATIFVWWTSLKFGLAPAKQALEAANASYGPLFWIGAVGLGLALPLVLGAGALLLSGRLSLRIELATILLTSLLIFVGGFIFRVSVVYAGQMS